MATAIVLVGCYYGYHVSGGPVGVGTATAKSMVLNIVLVHLIGDARHADLLGRQPASTDRRMSAAMPTPRPTSTTSRRRAPRARRPARARSRGWTSSARGAARATGGRGPRLLGLGELEALRDELLASPRRAARAPRPRERPAPRGCAWRRCSPTRPPTAASASRCASSAEPGCGIYYVGPRLGLVGMLAGWWEVKLSSGCPLAAG